MANPRAKWIRRHSKDSAPQDVSVLYSVVPFLPTVACCLACGILDPQP
jgi:hypothetical protein